MKSNLKIGLTQLTLRQFVRFWPWYIAAIFCLFATHWIQSHLPFFAKELAEMVSLGPEKIETAKFFWLALGIVVFRSGSRILFFYPARVMQKDLRVEILGLLEKVSPTRYRHHSDGQIFQIVSMDMEQIRALIGFAFMQVGNIIIAMIVLIPKIVGFHPQLILGLLPMLLSFVIFTVVVSRNAKLYRETQDAQGEVQNFLIESYHGKKTIKNFHAESSFTSLFKTYSYRELFTFYKAATRISFTMPLIPLGVGLSLLWGAHLVFTLNLGASSLILFSGFVFLFLEPLSFVSWIGVVIARTMASWDRIQELVTDLTEPSETEKKLVTQNPQKDIEHYEFNLDYWDENLKIDISAHKWTVLIGKTGCGKSHLITQMADNLMLHNSSISYVAQDPYLYNDTIKINIFLGLEPDEEKMSQAYSLLELFGLTFLANSKNELFEMEVGEHGKRLSGGQAKRLALVRSLMSGAEVLLWDDPFSSVDLILEKQIIDDMKALPAIKNKTIILSSHRLTTVRKSDVVIYLEAKMGIIEEGETQSLLLKESKTNEYFAKQMV